MPDDPDCVPSQGALTRRLRRLAEKYAAEPLEARHAKAVTERRVDLEPAGDGMCWLTAYLPLEVGARVDTQLESLARSLQAPDEDRTINQLRADVLADLLAGPEGPEAWGRRPSGGVRTELVVTVPVATLADDGHAPGEVIGYGPIGPDVARRLAGEATSWSNLWVDSGSGAPLAVGRRRYAPTLAQRRFLGARDATCRFPGCDKAAAAAEADHTREWSQGGSTDVGNLALLCRQHHRLKTLGHWKVRQASAAHAPASQTPTSQIPAAPDPDPPPGTLEWTSPAGRRYVTYPEGESPPPF
ncbi:HNH endonuclease signature motif containing protein [Sinomonas halotolerans]|uniref:DUF222 domain-containing protein n=1 Tax=Sinomonas halotolerans TaxID=1644133 RepID=A0ABU9WWY1_9MICC